MLQRAEIGRLFSNDDVDSGKLGGSGDAGPARDLALLATSRVLSVFEQLLNDAWPGHHDTDLLGGGGGVCVVENFQHTSGDPCMEGRIIPAGRSCTPRCDHGFHPSSASLHCSEDGMLTPARFTCSDRPDADTSGGSAVTATTAAPSGGSSWVHNLGIALSVTEAADDTCNGIYLVDREYNARPLYKSRAGAIIFYDEGWKMNWRDSVDGYHFSV